MKYPTKRPTRQQVDAALYLGGADIRLTAPKSKAQTGGRRSIRKGLDAESEGRAELRRQGYTLMQSHRSQTSADAVGIRQPGVTGPLVRAVQFKARATFESWACNEAVRDFLGLNGKPPYAVDAGCTREIWLKVDYRGWVATVVLDHLGAVSVTGIKAQEVEASVRTMLAQASRPTPAKRSTLMKRLSSCQ